MAARYFGLWTLHDPRWGPGGLRPLTCAFYIDITHLGLAARTHSYLPPTYPLYPHIILRRKELNMYDSQENLEQQTIRQTYRAPFMDLTWAL